MGQHKLSTAPAGCTGADVSVHALTGSRMKPFSILNVKVSVCCPPHQSPRRVRGKAFLKCPVADKEKCSTRQKNRSLLRARRRQPLIYVGIILHLILFKVSLFHHWSKSRRRRLHQELPSLRLLSCGAADVEEANRGLIKRHQSPCEP